MEIYMMDSGFKALKMGMEFISTRLQKLFIAVNGNKGKKMVMDS